MKSRKSLFTFLFFFFLSYFGFAQNSNFSFKIEPLFGTRNGTLTEYVYNYSSVTGSEYKLSLLDWDLQNSLFYGLNADVCLKNFHIIANWKSFIPSKRGYMQDSDWLQDAYYHTGRTDIKTNYSIHDNNLLSGLNLGIALKYDINFGKVFTLAPFAEFNYENYQLKANDGMCYYGNTIDGNTRHYYYPYDDINHRTVSPCTGNVVSLDRSDLYTWLGVETRFKTPDSRWIFSFDIAVSPYTYIYSIDNHHLTHTDYLDISSAICYAVKANTFVQFNFTNYAGIKISALGLLTGEIKGSDYSKTNTETIYKKTGALTGSSSKYFDIQISGVINFH
ncbi:hypothetical protein [Treponema sp.]|uniref:hypothetical protein n=1 Tax=Treponema sp. TaxID=166 RepID=UPI00298E3D26|nr:hypothetical protein [Treponema sp.]MCR5614231.1 hypothetical protein [Treponema sp.]